MAAKKNGKNTPLTENEETTDHVEEPVSGYSRAEKEVLIGNYNQTKELIKLKQSELDEAEELLSDCAFELQKAFGNKKIRIGDKLVRVTSRKREGTDAKTYFLKTIDLTVEETF